MKIVVIGFLGVASLIALSLAIFIAANWAPDRAAAGLKARWAPAPSTFLDAADMRVHLRDEGQRMTRALSFCCTAPDPLSTRGRAGEEDPARPVEAVKRFLGAA